MKILLDLFLSSLSIAIFLIPLIVIYFSIKINSKGDAVYWSDRVGKDNKIFKMPKFRTMVINKPELATDKLQDPYKWLTPIGDFLRKSSLDELPQIFCVFVGKMSIVGPRPALYNQYELIEMRTKIGIHRLLPGITGWAQINGRDELDLEDKVAYDKLYLQKKSVLFDIKIIFKTITKVLSADGIR